MLPEIPADGIVVTQTIGPANIASLIRPDFIEQHVCLRLSLVGELYHRSLWSQDQFQICFLLVYLVGVCFLRADHTIDIVNSKGEASSI